MSEATKLKPKQPLLAIVLVPYIGVLVISPGAILLGVPFVAFAVGAVSLTIILRYFRGSILLPMLIGALANMASALVLILRAIRVSLHSS